MWNVKSTEKGKKKKKKGEDADEKHGRQKMSNIDVVIPAVSDNHDGSARCMEHAWDIQRIDNFNLCTCNVTAEGMGINWWHIWYVSFEAVTILF